MYRKILAALMILTMLGLSACSGHNDLKAPCSFPSSLAEIDSSPCTLELIHLAQL